MEYFLSGFILRSAQVFVDASIWIAFGCFIAAIFRVMVGPAKTRTLFGDHTRFGLLVGWAIGMLLPVCSLGVIPVLVELRRSHVKPGTIVAFGLTAPLFNPISILYGLSLSNPFIILSFAAAAVFIVTSMGYVWGRFVIADESLPAESPEATPEIGLKRSLAVLYAASTSLAGWSLLYLVIGIAASAIVAASFSHGSLQTATEPDDVWAPAFMAAYVTPIYSTPLLAMSQIGGMFQHGNSVGAAFSLLILGAGVNLGVLVWFAAQFGLKRILVFAFLLGSITIGLAYLLDKPLYPKGVEAAGHTHVFDVYTHPYMQSTGQVSKSLVDAREYQLKNGSPGPVFLLSLILVGGVLRFVQTRVDLEKWFRKPAPPREGKSWDIVLPPWIIGLVACACLVVVSIFGTYVFYPPVGTALGELSAINATCVSAAKSGDFEIVKETVPFCEDLSRRLEVGVFLREGSVSEFKRTKAESYREKLDALRDYIEDGQTAKVDEMAMDVYQSYLRMSEAFRDE